MAFEELSGPKFSNTPRRVYASFDKASQRLGQTTYQPQSTAVLKDTPPSIVVALTQLAPIIRVLDTALAWFTWTSDDNWSSFLVLATWWLVCLYGDVVLAYAGNWVLLLGLFVGYIGKKTQARRVARAVARGDDVNKALLGSRAHQRDTTELLNVTLFELDCFRARCHLVYGTLEPLIRLIMWEEPRQSAIISVRLLLVSPIYVGLLYLLTKRTFILILGTIALTFTSPWFKVIMTVSWRLRIVRHIVSALIGINYLPGESKFMSAVMRSPAAAAFRVEEIEPNLGDPLSSKSSSRFTTTISIVENQRRWLGLGWTPSLLPHERAPWTDNDGNVVPDPDAYGLPDKRTIVEEDGVMRVIAWAWLDNQWRIEKDGGRDTDGWIYTDNTWKAPSTKEEYGKYTRRRRWVRNAECTEVVLRRDDEDELEVRPITQKTSRSPSLSLSPDKVKYQPSKRHSDLSEEEEDDKEADEAAVNGSADRSAVLSAIKDKADFNFDEDEPAVTERLVDDWMAGNDHGNSEGQRLNAALKNTDESRKEWREVSGGGKELVYVSEKDGDKSLRRRAFGIGRRTSTESSNRP
ncbi:hypothetical protein PYCC9005_000536 [Savitreella phatthalungensis]